jgi:hypothetical protein
LLAWPFSQFVKRAGCQRDQVGEIGGTGSSRIEKTRSHISSSVVISTVFAASEYLIQNHFQSDFESVTHCIHLGVLPSALSFLDERNASLLAFLDRLVDEELSQEVPHAESSICVGQSGRRLARVTSPPGALHNFEVEIA